MPAVAHRHHPTTEKVELVWVWGMMRLTLAERVLDDLGHDRDKDDHALQDAQTVWDLNYK